MADTLPHPAEPKLSSLEEVVERLEKLHREGYRSLGKWNLAQTCEHLSDWMGYMLDGYPTAPIPVRTLLWVMRVTVGKSLLRKILATGTMSAGGPTLQQTVHPSEGLEDEVSLSRFRNMAKRFQSHTGPYHSSPIFGNLSAEQGRDLQLVHCTHHLNFLQLKSPPESGQQPSGTSSPS